MVSVQLDTKSLDDYRLFLRIKSLPSYRFTGHLAEFPDEYAATIGCGDYRHDASSYTPPGWMFDYQKAITTNAITKRRYCLFVDCGYGKTAIFLEYARYVLGVLSPGQSILIVSPLMVIPQTLREASTFFGDDFPIQQVAAKNLQHWLNTAAGTIGITNYESIRDDITRGNLGCLILDESSTLKSHYGKWGRKCLEMGRGLNWKLAATGTPAPNDRIEYANHAVFMDAFPNVNSFLARFFVNKGQTQERWVLKPHALRPFYRALSHWAFFMTDPATFGWKDHANDIPPVHVHEHDVPLTDEQARLAFGGKGRLFADRIGGITNRSVLSQIAKGSHKGRRIESHKPGYIRELVESWPEESTIIWCRFNAEQKRVAEEFPGAASLTGDTPIDERMRMVDEFKAGSRKVLISKPKILGFGLNLQVATRQVFSSCEDSWESYYQAVKRSNRVGSTRPLNVHIPVTDIERLQMENVLRKAKRIDADTREQEALFREMGANG